MKRRRLGRNMKQASRPWQQPNLTQPSNYLPKMDLSVIVKEPEVQAEPLNEFCDAVFRSGNWQPTPALPTPSVMMGIPVFTPYLVHKELSTLDTSKIPGPDQLNPKFLKWLATSLAEPLTDLFNNFLATAVVSGDWNAELICSIFKTGDYEDVANYQPMSLTSVVCKVFERIFKQNEENLIYFMKVKILNLQ